MNLAEAEAAYERAGLLGRVDMISDTVARALINLERERDALIAEIQHRAEIDAEDTHRLQANYAQLHATARRDEMDKLMLAWLIEVAHIATAQHGQQPGPILEELYRSMLRIAAHNPAQDILTAAVALRDAIRADDIGHQCEAEQALLAAVERMEGASDQGAKGIGG
jgi:hypothetical protein